METAWPLWEVRSPAQLSSRWKNFSLYLAWTSPVSACAHCLLFSHLTPLRRASLCLLDNLLIGTVGLQLGALKAVSSPGWTSHFTQPLLMGQVPQPQPPWCPSSELTSFSYGGSNADGDGWYSCPPDPSSSQTNVLVAAKVTSLTYFLHVTVPAHVGPKSFIQTSRALPRELSWTLFIQQPASPTSVTHQPLRQHLEMPDGLRTICCPLPRERCRSV